MASPPCKPSRYRVSYRPRSPRYLFAFRGMLLPIEVVRVQWRRFVILGLKVDKGIYNTKLGRTLPAPWREKKQILRIDTFCRLGSLAMAARELNPKSHRYETRRIRYTVWAMLEMMHRRDHRADWVEREKTPTGTTKRKRGEHGRKGMAVLPPRRGSNRKTPLRPVRRGAA